MPLMQKTFTRATASILVIGFLALFVLVVTYNSNIAVGCRLWKQLIPHRQPWCTRNRQKCNSVIS